MSSSIIDSPMSPGATAAPATVSRPSTGTAAHSLLKASAAFWFITAVAGQWIFVYYITALYGGAAARGDWPAWNQALPHGYEPGNVIGNVALAAHLLLAAAITAGGPLQLVPPIRSRFPVFHHWNGRLYILAAFTMSIGGLYLVWSGRTVVGDLSQHIAISINAVLIMLCAIMAVRHAIARNIQTHNRWALRLFLVVSGVWFFRVGFMLWMGVHRAPVGFDIEPFQGPFLTFLSFAQYLLPLAVLELYLRARDGAGTLFKLATAGALFVLTLATAAGITGATMGLWLPRL